MQYIFKSENQESLIYKYKKQKLSNGFDIDIEKNLHFWAINIVILLDKYDFGQVQMVINTFYEHLFDSSYSEEEYNLLKAKSHKDFRYQETDNSYDHVKQLAIDMQQYPIENCMNFNYIWEELDKNEMEKLLNIMKQYRNWLVLIVLKKGDEKTEKEIFFGTKYKVSNSQCIIKDYSGVSKNQNAISTGFQIVLDMMNRFSCQSLIDYSQNFKILKDYKSKPKGLIEFLKNGFYDKPKKTFLQLKDKINDINVFEKKNNSGEFKFIYNPSFNVARSYVSIYLNTEITKENYIKTYMYLRMIKEKQNDIYYDFNYLNSFFAFSYIHIDGIEFVFEGYTENIHICIENYFMIFFDLDYEYIGIAKTLLLEHFMWNTVSKPSDLVFGLMKNEVYDFKPSNSDCIKEIKQIKEKDIKLDHKYYLKMFSCSDNSYEQFLPLYEFLCKKIQFSPKYEHKHVFTKKDLEGHTIDRKNKAVGIFIPNNKLSNLKSQAIRKMILPHFHEKFFTQMRTKEQWGYTAEVDSVN